MRFIFTLLFIAISCLIALSQQQGASDDCQVITNGCMESLTAAQKANPCKTGDFKCLCIYFTSMKDCFNSCPSFKSADRPSIESSAASNCAQDKASTTTTTTSTATPPATKPTSKTTTSSPTGEATSSGIKTGGSLLGAVGLLVAIINV